MFGRRADGVKVKGMQIIDKAMPYFMPMRIDAVNLYEQVVNCETMDQFILEQKKNGVHYSYTEIMMAACIRMLYERPKTNRFITNCQVFQRKYISVSISIKKKLTDDGEEVTLKMFFTGRESLDDVKRIFEEEVAKNIAEDEVHGTTKTAGFLCKLPNWCFKAAMALLRFGDNHGMLPRKLLDVSPFHTSIYVADLRSIKLDAVNHHLYNFGNTTIFATMGKVFYTPVANREGEVKVQKSLRMKYSLDERVCDGLYYSNSLRLLNSYIEHPELLKERLPEPELTGKALKKKQKADKKQAKKDAKKAKKAKKENKKK